MVVEQGYYYVTVVITCSGVQHPINAVYSVQNSDFAFFVFERT